MCCLALDNPGNTLSILHNAVNSVFSNKCNGNISGTIKFLSLILVLSIFLGPPPSYQSLFGEIQGARQSSSSTMDFLKKLILLLAGTSKYLTEIPFEYRPSLILNSFLKLIFHGKIFHLVYQHYHLISVPSISTLLYSTFYTFPATNFHLNNPQVAYKLLPSQPIIVTWSWYDHRFNSFLPGSKEVFFILGPKGKSWLFLELVLLLKLALFLVLSLRAGRKADWWAVWVI